MHSVAQAFQLLMNHLSTLGSQRMPLFDCLNLSLAEDVVADLDSPPFDKSLMDGYAVRATDVERGTVSLRVIDLLAAGQTPTKAIGPGEAIQIMTGAPLPLGADLVVKIEETTRDHEQVHIKTRCVTRGTNIVRRGVSARAGTVILHAGAKLSGLRIGILAELGQARALVHRRPTVAILATGDELVSVDTLPGPGQIRNSNEAMLVAQVQAMGAIPVPLGVARDNREDLRDKIQTGLRSDVLVLSGGVSAGMFDLVPNELREAGVQEVFHKVEMKPGKPVWFGIRDNTVADSKNSPATGLAARNYVFGLPGNPVSCLVCCELFVRTAIRRLLGEEPALPQSIEARLQQDFVAKRDRPTYHPALLTWTPAGPTVILVPWRGSSDLCGTVTANSMAFLSGQPKQYVAGESLSVISW
ncbi:MAG: molybdopterin molybdotransferase MoeA [Planctomycetales bacterium]|nr:molybdopterin molybdotransferase MoeA [Planctomycetales bacterium]